MMRHSGIAISSLGPAARAQVEKALSVTGNALKPQEMGNPLAKVAPIRQARSPALNKLEIAYQDRLIARHGKERVLAQAVTFTLANGLRYRPDFVVVEESMFEGHLVVALSAFETKGFARDDAVAKAKMAARVYPWIRWYWVTGKPRIGQWREDRILP
jgi:hypothetical protein